MKQLAYAMDFWSDGALKALFLEHEVIFPLPSDVIRNHVSYNYFRAISGLSVVYWDLFIQPTCPPPKENTLT